MTRLTALMCLLAMALLWLVPAQARTSDRDQPVNVTANYTDARATPNGISHLKGDVVVTQGTLKITSDSATIYFDAGSHVKRIVFTGKPAHFRQQDDQDKWIKGHANTLDYDIPKGIAKLVDEAHVEQEDGSSVSAQLLVYNTATSAMQASGKGDSRVHLIFQPSTVKTSTSSDKDGH